MAGKTPRMSRHGATSASASAASVVNTVVSAPSGILAQWTRGADQPLVPKDSQVMQVLW
jgi:hypothetical protein